MGGSLSTTQPFRVAAFPHPGGVGKHAKVQGACLLVEVSYQFALTQAQTCLLHDGQGFNEAPGFSREGNGSHTLSPGVVGRNLVTEGRIVASLLLVLGTAQPGRVTRPAPGRVGCHIHCSGKVFKGAIRHFIDVKA